MSHNAVSPLGAGAGGMSPVGQGARVVRRFAARAAVLPALAGPLLALALGALLLGRRPLTTDEADAVAAATGPFGDVVERALDRDPARAGYLGLLQPVVSLDDGERWVRAPSVLAATLASLLLYVVGRALAGRLAGVAASVAGATAGSMLAVSQQARPYALAVLAISLSTGLFVLAVRRGHPVFWASYALATALLPLTHPAASATVAAQLLALALVTPRPPLRLVGPALGFVVLENVLLLAAFALDRRQAPDAPLTLDGLGEGLARTLGWSPVLAGLAVWGVVALATRRVPRGEPWLAVLLGGVAALPLLAVVLASVAIPVRPEEALVVGVPGVALAAGAGLAALPRRAWQLLAAAAAVAAAAAGLGAWYVAAPTQDWRDAARLLDAEVAKGETVVAVPERARAAIAYYAPDERLALRARGNGAWVLVAGRGSESLTAARAVVDTPRYALLAQRSFGDDLVVQHWVRP